MIFEKMKNQVSTFTMYNKNTYPLYSGFEYLPLVK